MTPALGHISTNLHPLQDLGQRDTLPQFGPTGMSIVNPAKPTEVKRKLGNPGKRALPTALTVLPPAPLTDRAAPDHFGPAGLRMWSVCRDAAGTWIAASDTENVRLLCEAMDRRAEYIARLASDGYVLFTDKGYAYQHPIAGMLTSLEAQITKWLSLLGLTPSDRGRLGVAEVRAQSALERIRAERAKLVNG